MAKENFSDKINSLFARSEWVKARRFLEAERKRDSQDHWVLTQLGVTYYEQRRYAKALQLFRTSREIVPDCPLTLWHLAGALDSLGKHTDAMKIYAWLWRSKTSAEQDPCWESETWAQALKTDCVYGLGVCLQHLAKKNEAERFFRLYLNLLLSGSDGMYSVEDVSRKIRELHRGSKHRFVEGDARKAVNSAVHALTGKAKNGVGSELGNARDKDSSVGRRVVSKR